MQFSFIGNFIYQYYYNSPSRHPRISGMNNLPLYSMDQYSTRKIGVAHTTGEYICVCMKYFGGVL